MKADLTTIHKEDGTKKFHLQVSNGTLFVDDEGVDYNALGLKNKSSEREFVLSGKNIESLMTGNLKPSIQEVYKGIDLEATALVIVKECDGDHVHVEVGLPFQAKVFSVKTEESQYTIPSKKEVEEEEKERELIARTIDDLIRL